MKILMVLTSHDELGDTGNKTGFWLEEFAAPYYVFKDAGADVTLASPKGSQPPLDPNSDSDDARLMPLAVSKTTTLRKKRSPRPKCWATWMRTVRRDLLPRWPRPAVGSGQ